MADITVLRSEIKAWERSFKETNGRDASIQDIKELPHIAEKYKLYKKLTKYASQAPQTSKPSTSRASPPTTPPRTKSRNPDPSGTSVLIHSRHAETTAPLTTYNPFSPQKNKQKRIESKPGQACDADKPLPNPFATPVKNKKTDSHGMKRGLSPDPFPLIESLPLAVPSLPVPNTAISRARKRLRGEPVSPSPNKSKKRRANTQLQTVLPFKPINVSSTAIKHQELPEDSDEDAGNSSFVGESPVKQPTGSKSFQILFDDIVSLDSRAKGKAKAPSLPPDDIFHERLDTTKVYVQTKLANGKPAKSMFVDAKQPQAGLSKSTTQTQSLKDTQTKKRRLSLPDEEDDVVNDEHDAANIYNNNPFTNGTQYGIELIPPSPPPADPYDPKQGKQMGKGRGRGKTIPGGSQRKRPKILGEDSDVSSEGTDDWEQFQSYIRVMDHRGPHHKRPDDDDDIDIAVDVEDPVLASTHRSHTQSEIPNYDTASETLATPLSKLSGLSLSPSRPSNKREVEEAQLIRGLLYRRPVKGRLYDARRGGEIWGVGEGDEDEDEEHDMLGLEPRGDGKHSNTELENGESASKTRNGTETEEDDDWESEPVPWEVGEL